MAETIVRSWIEPPMNTWYKAINNAVYYWDDDEDDFIPVSGYPQDILLQQPIIKRF